MLKFLIGTILLILKNSSWDYNPDLCLNTIHKQTNFESDPKIDKTRNLIRKCSTSVYNYTHLEQVDWNLNPDLSMIIFLNNWTLNLTQILIKREI